MALTDLVQEREKLIDRLREMIKAEETCEDLIELDHLLLDRRNITYRLDILDVQILAALSKDKWGKEG